ncbi:hypothetical protein [Sphingomonas sp. KR3-1]|uniref:hypothetical protein n=1 Tax=Sphingomonas sp. KR3-1 TaxID=3156611 RepID=UPI0032B43EC7
MKLLACLPLLLLAAASAPSRPEIQVAPAAMRLWMPREGRVSWVSDGVHVSIAPAPCDNPPRSEGCRFDPQNNQAEVTVTPANGAPVTVRTSNQTSYYRLAVVRFHAGDARPGLVIENQSGGSAGDVWVQLLLPEGAGYHEQWLPDRLQGALPATLADLSGDGAIDLVFEDGRFAYVFGCGACTPRPPRVFTVRAGKPVDVSREPGYARAYRAEMARLAPICLSSRRYRNGACAAYVADAARVGQFDKAWAKMLRHWERAENDLWQSCSVPRSAWAGDNCPPASSSHYRTFPESLRAFLRATGYIP